MAAMAAITPFLTAAGTVLSIAGGIRALTAKAPKAPNMGDLMKNQTAAPERAMPTQDAAMTQEAKRRQIVAAQTRGGRQSTFLTDSDNEKFGS